MAQNLVFIVTDRVGLYATPNRTCQCCRNNFKVM